MLRSRRGAKPTKHESFSRSSSFIRLAPAQWSSVPPPGARHFFAGDVYTAGKTRPFWHCNCGGRPCATAPVPAAQFVCTLVHFVYIMRVFSGSLVCGLLSLPVNGGPGGSSGLNCDLCHIFGVAFRRTGQKPALPPARGGEGFQQITPRCSKPPTQRRKNILPRAFLPEKPLKQNAAKRFSSVNVFHGRGWRALYKNNVTIRRKKRVLPQLSS